MSDIDDLAREAGRGLVESASHDEPPDIVAVKTARRRRAGITAAAGAFAGTLVIVGAVALSGGGSPGRDVAQPPPTVDEATTTAATQSPVLFTAVADGVALEWPAGWESASENLTPAYRDPLELFSIATFPLRAELDVCAPFPWQAVVDFPAGGGFITLRERFRNADAFQPRPAAFGPEAPPYALPEGDCLDNTSRGDIGTMRWFEFEDQGRFFEMLVVLGTDAGAEIAAEAWAIANSLVVEPGEGVPLLTLDEVYAGNTFVIDTGDGPEVCGSVMESLPPQCGGPNLIGLDWTDVPWAESAQGVIWADVYIEFRVIDGALVLESAPSEHRDVVVDEPEFPPPPPDLDVMAVFEDVRTIKVNEWPAGIFGLSGFWPDDAGGFVGISALIITDEGRRWLDERYGPGAVRATGSLRPLSDIAVSDAAPASAAAPRLEGEPDIVAARNPVGYCGAYFYWPNSEPPPMPDVVGLTFTEDSLNCFEDRIAADEPAELIVVVYTIEGDPIITINRHLGAGWFETFTDTTRDAFGTHAWFSATCTAWNPDTEFPGAVGCENIQQIWP